MNQHITKSALASTDRDALAFLEAAQIYNANQQRAIVNLVRSLKRVGLWSKMKAIYPFVGGTAASHKWNLKDPRDVDAAFRLTFSGGWTHSANGADPNGTNGYADTFLAPSTSLSLNSSHMSYYSRQNINENSTDFGTTHDSGSAAFYLFSSYSNGIAYYRANRYTTAESTTTSTHGDRYFILNRNSATTETLYINDAKNDKSVASSAIPTTKVFIAAMNRPGSGGALYFSSKECAFATIGDGLTDTDATNLYNIVDLYQKRLGRAV